MLKKSNQNCENKILRKKRREKERERESERAPNATQ